ncbi:UDP-N-acetylglucosamine 1-carboxyvinyltransferase [uncultured Megasphaera sp.]|uniref:UDP-N-acetylglucosamine 1-carboxyvinyltransferase n=1 Tax=uncultured Megasphaera sp. TaxID=165188 RepID=UPI00265A06EC|nr:UDP-N-acetylglucosamine 1-carboxyvinyltransferase [uncultured Megasphaera sp.]
MEKLVIHGGKPLMGTVRVSGAKNAVLPIIVASMLGTTKSTLTEIPKLDDVHTVCDVIASLGVHIENPKKGVLEIDARELSSTSAPYDLVRRMRASFLVMGPLLARKRHAQISLPGGCSIGARPIDLHLKAFEAMGAVISLENGNIEASVPDGLKGAQIYLDFPSVGATENILMAAALADGKTILENAAEEPEIVDLATYLNSMGANIRGAGTNVIRIEGVKELHGAAHSVIPDRIEAGTFMIGAAMTGGNVYVENALSEHLKPLVSKLKEAGAEVHEDLDGIRVIGHGTLRPADIKTLPYPGFPTDMQAQFMALATICNGTSVITETVFENRFMHVDEFKRMGAKIRIEGRSAIVEGVAKLKGADVNATDLRAGAALVMAGLVAEGETRVGHLHHIDRGYDHFVLKLQRLGADIVRVNFEEEEK